MIPAELTLKQLWFRKAQAYYNRSRNRMGQPTKTLDECYADAQADYGPTDLDAFNKAWKAYWNNIVGRHHGIMWADGTSDSQRECAECGRLCDSPVHKDKYDEVVVGKVMEFDNA